MTPAQQVIWQLHILHVQRVVDRQRAAFEKGERSPDLVLLPPRDEEVAIINKVIQTATEIATQETERRMMGPLIDACDRVDGIRRKTPVVEEVKEILDEAYKKLHELKSDGHATATSQT